MSQNATTLPTTGTLTGLALVQKINDALDTVDSLHSGPADPGAIGANRFWADTTNFLLKQRNSANSAWVTRGALDADYFGLLPASYFRPHAAATPNMTVLIDAGKLQNATTKVSQAQQTTSTFTAPVSNPRYDLIVIDQATAAYSIVAGTEAASPVDPAIPSGSIAVARVRLTVGMSSITDASIDDLRPGFFVPSAASSTMLGYRNLKIDALGINNFNCVITADEAVLENSANQYYTARAVNKTVNANGTVGAPLSIMSARAASTWYFPWLWYNAALGLTATLDPSSTAPTAPVGYAAGDYKGRLPGACRTDASGSAYLLQTSTRNKKSEYVVLSGSNTPNIPLMCSGAQGSATVPTWVALAVGAFVPPTASVISAILGAGGGSYNAALLAPNNNFGAWTSLTNPAPFQCADPSGTQLTTIRCDMLLESTNIYTATMGGFVGCMGWEDNL